MLSLKILKVSYKPGFPKVGQKAPCGHEQQRGKRGRGVSSKGATGGHEVIIYSDKFILGILESQLKSKKKPLRCLL